MMIQAHTVGHKSPNRLTMRCPRCGSMGVFQGQGVNDIVVKNLRLGHRYCPGEECALHVFIVAEGNKILRTYPPLRLDFDKENIPPNVIDALDEAITCHANECYVAAAILVRRSLEELCDAKRAAGESLKQRVSALGDEIMIPQELLDGLDDLRILGNDAAHVEAKVYKQIGKEELDVAIEFAKEVLKAVYQYTSLLGRLKALKNGPEGVTSEGSAVDSLSNP